MPEGLNTHAHSGQPKPRRRVSSIHRSLRAIRLLAPACDMSQLFRWRIFLRNHPPRRSPGAYQRMIRFPLRASIPINPNVANELHIYSVLLFATTFRELIASDSMPAFEKITMQNNPVARARRQVLHKAERWWARQDSNLQPTVSLSTTKYEWFQRFPQVLSWQK